MLNGSVIAPEIKLLENANTVSWYWWPGLNVSPVSVWDAVPPETTCSPVIELVLVSKRRTSYDCAPATAVQLTETLPPS